MNIEKRIKALQPYVIQIRFVKGIGIVDTVFKDGWKVPTSKVIGFEKGKDDDVNYYLFYTDKEDLGLDDVFDYIEQVINMNIEREKKYELLKVKTEELKDVFRGNPLSKLVNMKFVLGDDKLIPDNMPEDFDDMSIIDKVVVNESLKEEVKEVVEEEVKDLQVENTKLVPTRKINNMDIELPPKGSKIELEEYTEPTIVCNCQENDVCPVCVDEKM